MWRQIGGYGDFSKKPIKVIHSRPLREEKTFFKGLFYFYRYSQTKSLLLYALGKIVAEYATVV